MSLTELPLITLTGQHPSEHLDKYHLCVNWREAEYENEDGGLENINVVRKFSYYVSPDNLEKVLLEMNFISYLLERSPAQFFSSLISINKNLFQEKGMFDWITTSGMFNVWLPKRIENIEVSYINTDSWEKKSDYTMHKNEKYRSVIQEMFPNHKEVAMEYKTFNGAIYQLDAQCKAFREKRALIQLIGGIGKPLKEAGESNEIKKNPALKI